MPRRQKPLPFFRIGVVREKVDAVRDYFAKHGMAWIEEDGLNWDVTFKVDVSGLAEPERDRIVSSIPYEFFAVRGIIVGDSTPEELARAIEGLPDKLE